MDPTIPQSSSLSQQHNGEAPAEPQLCTLVPIDPQAEARSQAIDRVLEEDAKIRKAQVNVLPFGAFTMREVIKQLKSNDEIGLTENELIGYRHDIHQRVVDCTRALVDLTKSSEVQLEEYAKDCYNYLCDYIAVTYGDVPLNEEAGQAIEVVWKTPSVTNAFQSSADYDLKKSSMYFFQEISRIAAPNYVPTEADIIQSHKGIRGIEEHRFLVDGLSINLIDAGRRNCDKRKWIPQFDNIDAILFVVDLPSYDEVLLDCNGITNSIPNFDGVVNSKWFANSKCILFFNNISAFRQKLFQKPFGDYFPDYSGGTDADQAIEYLIQLFSQANRGKQKIYSYLVDPYVASNIKLVAAAINDSSH